MFRRVSTTVWEIFGVMMLLQALHRTKLPCVVHLDNKPSFSFFLVDKGQRRKVLSGAPFLVMHVFLAHLVTLDVIFILFQSISCPTDSALGLLLLVFF